MKQIRAPKSGQILVSTSGTNATEAMKLQDEARLNGSKVIYGAAAIERQLEHLISEYFFTGQDGGKRMEFEGIVLGSS